MANSITLMQEYVPILDEVYKEGSLTARLDSNQDLISFNGKTFHVPKIDMDGLASHTRGGNYVAGDVSLTWETKTPDYDRNRKFSVDAMDDQETAGLAFGALSGEFIRTKVIPEIDAVRFSKYYATALAASNVATGTLSTGALVKSALRTATAAMDNAEVPMEGRILYCTTAIKGLIDDLPLTDSRMILDRFSDIVIVPQSRFYTEIVLNDGTTSGQEAGGFTNDGEAINFLIVHPTALIQGLKHVAPKYIPASVNQSGDNDEFAYRVYGINDKLDNKVKAIYGHALSA